MTESNNKSKGNGAHDGSQSTFVYVARGDRHSIGIDDRGEAFSWGKTNGVGQLGRTTGPIGKPVRVEFALRGNGEVPRPTRAFVSDSKPSESTGHSALLDDRTGSLWMAGCDRWQQLGLGSSKAGSSGYTWHDGKLWHDTFQPTPHVSEFLKTLNGGNGSIRDVALGGDHTLVLSSDRRTVVAYGKGGDGQLGLVGKPFVSAPVRSRTLSSKNDLISAVCAVDACSMTIGSDGNILERSGKCRREASRISHALSSCIQRAKREGLLDEEVKN